MRDPREIYPGEPISSIMNRLSSHGRSYGPKGGYTIPIPEWLAVALIIGFAIFGIGTFAIDQLIDRGFFG